MNDIGVECADQSAAETSTGDPCEKSTGRWSTGANLSSWNFLLFIFLFKKKKKFGEGRRWRRCGKKREADGADCVPPLFCLSSAIFARPLSGGRRTPPRKKYSDAIFFFFLKKGANGLIWDADCSIMSGTFGSTRRLSVAVSHWSLYRFVVDGDLGPTWLAFNPIKRRVQPSGITYLRR